MPSLPPASAHRAARTRHQQALENSHPGSVTIGGVVFLCALHVGPVEPKLQEDGIDERMGQDVKIIISKSILPTAPAPRTEVTVNSITYRIVNSGPQNAIETAWHLTARRFA